MEDVEAKKWLAVGERRCSETRLCREKKDIAVKQGGLCLMKDVYGKNGHFLVNVNLALPISALPVVVRKIKYPLAIVAALLNFRRTAPKPLIL